MPDGARPEAGGWNRVHLTVDDLLGEVARLRAVGVQFRNDIVTGPAARAFQWAEDPGRVNWWQRELAGVRYKVSRPGLMIFSVPCRLACLSLFLLSERW
jgi:hypothetical protein